MRFLERHPWTRSHERFLKAWAALALAHRGQLSTTHTAWIGRKFGVRTVRELTVPQARQACRCINAWRAGMEGRTSGFRPFPRQFRRNRRRALAFAAANTATRPAAAFDQAIQGTALEALGRLVPTESEFRPLAQDGTNFDQFIRHLTLTTAAVYGIPAHLVKAGPRWRP